MTENYEPTSDEVADDLDRDGTPPPESWIARVLLVVAARERLIKQHNLATGGTIPAPTPPSTSSWTFNPAHAYVLNLSPTDRELLHRISDQVTFDHQGERP